MLQKVETSSDGSAGARVGEAADNKAEPGAPRQKLSKKAHIAAKKAAKRAKRGAASDEEDLPPTDAGQPLSLLHLRS